MKLQLKVSGIILYAFVLCLTACKPGSDQSGITENAEYQVEYPFRLDQFKGPIVVAHKAHDKSSEYPENSLPSIINLSNQQPLWVECDVRKTVDGELALFHDEGLANLTRADDEFERFTLDEVQQLLLKNPQGELTTFHVASLTEVLWWNKRKDRTILVLDIKNRDMYSKVIKEIREQKQQEKVIIMAPSLEDAIIIHDLEPALVMSIPLADTLDWIAIEESAIPTDRVIAFFGFDVSSEEFLKFLESRNVPSIVGTMRDLQNNIESNDFTKCREWIEHGVNILVTDHPLKLYNYLNANIYQIDN